METQTGDQRYYTKRVIQMSQIDTFFLGKTRLRNLFIDRLFERKYGRPFVMGFDRLFSDRLFSANLPTLRSSTYHTLYMELYK